MAMANRHYIPGYVWHITQRCHKREFLLRFAKDRLRWMQWLYEAKQRYGIVILNCMITSNHIHLLVKDAGQSDAIPMTMQLIASRVGQEYNQRKHRTGAFWQDRYHAVAVESGSHFRRCLVYKDMNMVRAGVISHPSEWLHSGYREIQRPRRKYVLISYDELKRLAGYLSYEAFRDAHHQWVEAEIKEAGTVRKPHWTESIAVGSQSFIETIKKELAIKAKGRKTHEIDCDFTLREPQFFYNDVFGIEK